MSTLPELVKETKLMLGLLTDKPVLLQEDLLSRPPLRFLHDLISNVVKNTGYPAGLLDSADSDSKSVKSWDKRKKVDFCQRLIDCTTFALEDLGQPETFEVTPPMILSGKRCELTNKWIQGHCRAGRLDAFHSAAERAEQALSNPDAAGDDDEGEGGAGDGGAAERAKALAEAEAKAAAEKLKREQAEKKKRAEAEEKKRAEAERSERDRQAKEAEQAAAAKAEAEARAAAAAEAKRKSAAAEAKKAEEARAAEAARAAAATTETGEGGEGGDDGTAVVNSYTYPPLRPSSKPIPLPPPETGEDYVAATMRLVRALVNKPPLKDKLVQRPPFRFLCDIFFAIEEKTGWPAGLFTEQDRDKDNKLDQKGRLLFLQKVIETVQACNNCSPSLVGFVSPKSIAAGRDCDRTNLLVQEFVKAAASGISAKDTLARADAIRRGVPPDQLDAPTEKPVALPAPKPAPAEKKIERPAPKVDEAPRKKIEDPVVAPPIVQPPPPVQPVEPEGETDDVESGLARLQTKNAAGLSRLKTSRRAPPKLKDANLVDEKKEVKSAQPKNLIMEGGEANDDSDHSDEDVKKDKNDGLGEDNGSRAGDLAQGKLMSDLLKMAGQGEKEKDDAKGENGFAFKRLPSARPENRTAGLFSSEQIKLLQAQIQAISASANPLGKCIDYIFEDVDQMQAEHAKWSRDFAKNKALFEVEKLKTKGLLEPLERQLADSIQQTEEQEAKILSLRADILKNQLELEKLLDRKSTIDAPMTNP